MSSDELTRSVVRAAAPAECLSDEERQRLRSAIDAATASAASAGDGSSHRAAPGRLASASGHASAPSRPRPLRPDPPTDGERRSGRLFYLVGAVGTAAACVALLVVFSLRGSEPQYGASDRMLYGSADTSANQAAPVTISNGSPAAGGENRDPGPGRRPGDPGLAERLSAVRERLQTGRKGWNVHDIELTVGEPDAVVNRFLEDLHADQRVESWQHVGRRLQPDRAGGDPSVTLFYTVVPYDHVRGAPHLAPEELFRFEFAPTRDRHVEWCETRLAELPDKPEYYAERDRVSSLLESLRAAESVYQLMQLERVLPSDPDYAEYMPH